jgi:hypothetical protein
MTYIQDTNVSARKKRCNQVLEAVNEVKTTIEKASARQ